MNKKQLKILLIVITIMLIIIICIPKSFAITPKDITGDDIEIETDFIDDVINILRVIGVFVSVGAIMIMGIKYMLGSLDERATYKKMMAPYLAGCILIFGAATIAPDILETFKELSEPEDVGNTVLGLIRVVGTFIAVGVLMILGIKYMLGSVEERAGYKKAMIPYLIGASLLFAAVNITLYVYQWFNLDGEKTVSVITYSYSQDMKII